MSATHKPLDDEAPVVIDRHFVVVQATNAAARFFRPLIVSFEKSGPNSYVARLKPEEDRR